MWKRKRKATSRWAEQLRQLTFSMTAMHYSTFAKMPTTQKTARDPISRDLVLGTLRGVVEMLNENVIA
jgi:hypothetical protein